MSNGLSGAFSYKEVQREWPKTMILRDLGGDGKRGKGWE
jgi:hypothetical protein